MMTKVRLVALLTLGLLVGCDSGVPTDVCPTAVDAELDFFPVMEGDVWTFEAESGKPGGGLGEVPWRTRGVTTWTFERIECEPEEGLMMRVIERFDGIRERHRSVFDPTWMTTDTLQSRRTLSFKRYGVDRSNLLDLGTYAQDPIPALYASSASDTAQTETRSGGSFLQYKGQVLVRGRGAVELYGGTRQGAGGGLLSNTLVRID
ncbi:MAG: hypothetical protein AAGI71_16250 [Bacteroidota bacterium]